MGPGRGTLMRDILRTARIDPGFLAAADIHLVETSERLRDIQRADAGRAAAVRVARRSRPCPPCRCCSSPTNCSTPFPSARSSGRPPAGANAASRLDADGALAFMAGPPLGDLSLLPPGADAAPAGAVFEYAPAREAIAATLGERLAAHGGAALVIDYGHARSGFADTLQALRAHAHVPSSRSRDRPT
jgi:NADH dehydrogenase [ubiquinone] 1 alpha subcomplex assembly factor 7